MTRKQIAVGAAAAILVAVGVYASLGRNGDEDAGEVVTAAVDRGAIVASVTATGAVRPVVTVQVGTYVSGPILAIDADFNSPVKKGQRVAKIDPAQFDVRLRKAEASLANARAQLEKGRADLVQKKRSLQRTAELAEQKLVSESEVDLAKSSAEQAVAQVAVDEAGVTQAEAERDEARVNLAYTDIVSPVDGVVVSRNVDVGQTVAASFQTPVLFQIAEDLSRMEVATSVSESDIGVVRDEQTASFAVDAYPSRTFEGRVTQVRNAPVTVQNVVTYEVVIGVANPDLALKPGMTATVTIVTAKADDALRVPIRALRFDPEAEPGAARSARRDDGVWLVDRGGELRRVAVEVGIRDDRFAEIRAGEIRPGDEVVVSRKKTEERAEGPRIPGVPHYGPARRSR
jgi:HlyD family secretion protein